MVQTLVRKKVSCNTLGIWKNAYISTEHFTTLVYKFHQTLKTRNSAKFSKVFQPWTWGKLLSHKLYPKIVAESATCLKRNEPQKKEFWYRRPIQLCRYLLKSCIGLVNIEWMNSLMAIHVCTYSSLGIKPYGLFWGKIYFIETSLDQNSNMKVIKSRSKCISLLWIPISANTTYLHNPDI